MASEVTSIGVSMETDGVERGIRTLQQLANQGPRVEKSMQGIEAAASKADKSLNGIGAGSDRGLKAIAGSASGAEQGLNRVGKSAEDTKRYIDNLHRSITGMGSIQTAPLTRSLDSVKTSALGAGKAVDLLKSTLAVTGIGIGVKEVISLADGYTKFTAQLKLASKSADDYAASMTAVRRISLDAQQGLAETGTLYARIANGTAELGLSQQKLSDITETVALGLKVSGATASESASAMLQLSQAFASGVLRGEEFNAVNESAPRLMKALADGIGVPIGALRELASEGKITSQVMADALPKALESIRKEAEQIQTIGGSFTILKNNLLEFVGAGDKASGATKAISSSVTGLANNLDTIAVAAGSLALVLAGRYVGSVVTANAGNIALAASTAKANVAAVALSATMSPAAAAVSAFGIAARGASTAVLALFGGSWWGLAATAITAAAGALLYFRDTTEETIKSIGGLNQPLEDLKKKLDDLPPEKRVSVIIDIEKSGREAIKQADRDIEDLVQSVAGAANIKMPLDEFEKLTDSIRDTAKSGGDLTPILQKAAQSGGIPQSVLQSWLNLAANIREAQAAAGKAQAIANAAPKVEIMGPTIAQRDAQAQRDAAEALKGAAAYKSKAEQMAEVRSQGDKLREALRNLTATNQGTSKAAEELRARLVGVDERLASMAKSGRSASGSVKQVENAYSSLSKRVGDYIEQLRIEATQSDKASTAQKLQIQLDDLLVKSKGKVTAAKVASLKADIQTARSMEEEAKAVKRTVDAYQQYIKDQEDIARADVELSKAKEALWKSIADQNIELENQSRMLELEASNIGKSAYERTLANEVLKAQIELEKELRDISNNQTLDAGAKDEAEAAARARAVKKIALAERKAYVTEWEKTSQTIGDTLADYIMGGGKDAAQYLKRLFSTLVLQPIVQTVVGGIMGTGPAGVAGIASGGGGIGGLLNTASNIKTLMGLSGSGAALGSLGVSNAVGMAGGDALGALISTNATNWGVTAGSSMLGTIGAALPWVAGGLAIASLFGGNLMGSLFGRKLKDSGIEGTFGGSQGFTGNTYEFYKGGAFRSNKTKRNPLEEATRSQFADQFTGAQSAIKTMGDTLGLITDAVDGATYSIKLSLKGLSEADASKAIQAEFDRIAESMAGLVLVTNEYSIADENRIETLARLSGSLTAFNGSLELLGLSAYDASLQSADAAYKIISAFGGLENYGQAIQGYYQNFYSEAERMEALQKQLRETLTGLDLSIDPAMGDEAKEQFRAAVEAAMAGGQVELASQLLAMSGSFATAADYAGKAAEEAAQAAEEAAQAAEEAAQAARQVMEGLLADRRQLEAELLRAQGDAAGYAAAMRAIATEGYTPAEIAAWDYNDALRAQIAEAERAAQATQDAAAAMASLRQQASGIVQSQQQGLDSLIAGLQRKAEQASGGYVGNLLLSGSEFTQFAGFADQLDGATQALEQLQALGLGDELAVYAEQIGAIVQQTKEALAGALSAQRLMAGDAAGAIAAAISASMPQYSDFTKNGQFNAGAFNSAMWEVNAKAASGLIPGASASGLSIPGVGDVLGTLMGEITTYGREVVLRDLRASGAEYLGPLISGMFTGVYEVLAAKAETAMISGPGLASVMAARREFGSVQAEFDAFAKAFEAVQGSLNAGRISAEEAEKAIDYLTASFGDLTPLLSDAAAQAARVASAALDLSSAGMASVDYYFGSLTGLVQGFNEAAAQANSPLAQATNAIGLLDSTATAFGQSASAALEGARAAVDGYLQAAQAAREQGAWDASWAYSSQAAQAQLSLNGLTAVDSRVSQAQLIADAAAMASGIMTTASAAKAAEELAGKLVLGEGQSMRDLSLLVSGVSQYDNQAFYEAFARISDALGQGAISSEQYQTLFDYAMGTYQGVSDEAKATASAFERLRDSMKSFADSLLIGDKTTLSPEATLSEMQRQYAEAFKLASGGDADAIREYQSLANGLLDKSLYSTQAEYNVAFGRKYGDARTLEAQGVNMLAQQQNNSVVTELKSLNASLTKRVGDLEKNLTAALAQIAKNTADTVKGVRKQTEVMEEGSA